MNGDYTLSLMVPMVLLGWLLIVTPRIHVTSIGLQKVNAAVIVCTITTFGYIAVLDQSLRVALMWLLVAALVAGAHELVLSIGRAFGELRVLYVQSRNRFADWREARRKSQRWEQAQWA